METFSWLKLQLCRSGILYYDNCPRAKNIAFTANCIFFTRFILFFSTTGYYMIFTARTSNEFTVASIYTITVFFVMLWFVICLWNRDKIGTLLVDLDTIIEKRSERCEAIKTSYKNSYRKSVTLTKQIHKIYNQILVPMFIITPILTSIIKFIRSDFSNESFQLIFPATFPFDWKTPVGYLACVWIQAIVTLTITNIFSTVIAMIFGLCYFATSFVSDLQIELSQIDDDMAAVKNGKYSPLQIIKLKKRLGDFIDFHGEARQFTRRVSDLFGSLINGYLIYVIAIFGDLSLTMNSSINSGDVTQIVQSGLLFFTAMPLLYLFCHFAENIETRFEELGDNVYQLNWYTLPLDMQKDLVRVIAISQKQIFVRGYGEYQSTRRGFKEMLSYQIFFLLVLRKIGK